MLKIKAIIVDDEESARNVLNNLVERFCPEIEVVEKCRNVTSAVEKIKQHKPDIVFLDIEMPNYAGYEIISFFDEVNFAIIFVTAYDKYAIKAFEVSAVDYILKPIEIKRLRTAVDKVLKQIQLKNQQIHYQTLSENLKSDYPEKIIVLDKDIKRSIKTQDIIAIEAQQAYTCIYTICDNYIMSKNLHFYEMAFENNPDFFRSHKSWLINLKHFQGFSKKQLKIELTKNISARISKYKLADFETLILQ